MLREEGCGWGCTDDVGGACLSLDDITSILCILQKGKFSCLELYIQKTKNNLQKNYQWEFSTNEFVAKKCSTNLLIGELLLDMSPAIRYY